VLTNVLANGVLLINLPLDQKLFDLMLGRHKKHKGILKQSWPTLQNLFTVSINKALLLPVTAKVPKSGASYGV
jgi:hypothetical protein